jgi:DNA-binding transcriptional LysR family regulator
VELRHLRYFLAVAEELHFGRAAERLGIAQPPLSQQIKDLEIEIGVRLFDRTNRSVHLTAAGAAFRTHAIETLDRANKAIDVAKRIHRGEEGALRVGFAGTVSYTPIPSAILGFRKENPLINLELHEMSTPDQLKALSTEKIDVGLVRVEDSLSPKVKVQVVLRERFRLAIAKGHTLSSKARVSLGDLREEPFIMYPRTSRPGMHDQIRRACRSVGFEMIVAQYASQVPTILSFVSAGLGVAIVPESVSTVRWNGVDFKPLVRPTMQTVVGLAHSADSISPLCQRFVDHLLRS